MPTVPRYSGPQIEEQLAPNARQSTAPVADIRAGGMAIAEGIGQVGSEVNKIYLREKAKADSSAALEGRRKLLDWERTNFDDPENPGALYNNKGRASIEVGDKLWSDYVKYRDQVMAGLANDDQRRMFEPFAQQHEFSLSDRRNNYIRREVDSATQQEFKASTATSIEAFGRAARLGDQKRMQAEMDAGVAGLRLYGDQQGWGSRELEYAEAEYRSNAHAAAMQSLIDGRQYDQAREYFDANAEDMQSADAARYADVVNRIRDEEEVDGFVAGLDGARAGFDPVIAHVLRTEGGYAAQDGSSGAPVNFGINQGANPDVDVKNLTKRQAVEIYRQRYWNKINGDSLPPELQLTAMDAAVNQGVGNAKKWLAESGGDVAKFNDLRRAHYDRLKASGKYTDEEYRSWMSRLAGVQSQDPAGGYGDKLRAIDADPLLSSEQKRLARAKVRERKELEQFEEAQRAGGVTEEISRHLATGGTMTNLPPDLRMRAEQFAPKELLAFERSEARGGTAQETDPVKYHELVTEASERPLDFMKRDLRRDLPNLSASDFQELVRLQAGVKSGRETDLAKQAKLISSVSDPLLAAAGFRRPAKKGGGYEWVPGKEQVGSAFYKELGGMVRSYREKNGKDPGQQEVQAWADSLMVKSVTGADWFDGAPEETTFAFQLPSAAAAKLREGANTKFGNGQVWTLKDGKPTRIK